MGFVDPKKPEGVSWGFDSGNEIHRDGKFSKSYWVNEGGEHSRMRVKVGGYEPEMVIDLTIRDHRNLHERGKSVADVGFSLWNRHERNGILVVMTDVTQIFSRIKQDDPAAAAELLPLVYDELRKLAERELGKEASGQTLQPTALVHEAYLRLVGPDDEPCWNHRGHFYAAAAEAMRRILIEKARQKKRLKHGGKAARVNLDPASLSGADRREDLLAVDEALTRFEQVDRRKASLVKLRFFGGLTMQEAAKALEISLATAERDWSYARVWLLRELADVGEETNED